jgi:hypothetical protein
MDGTGEQKLARFSRTNASCFFSYIKYKQQYCEKQITLRRVTYKRGKVKEGN